MNMTQCVLSTQRVAYQTREHLPFAPYLAVYAILVSTVPQYIGIAGIPFLAAATGWFVTNLCQMVAAKAGDGQKNPHRTPDPAGTLGDILGKATIKSGPSGLINIIFSVLMVIFGLYTMQVHLAQAHLLVKAGFALIIFFAVLLCLQLNYRFSKVMEYMRHKDQTRGEHKERSPQPGNQADGQ